MRHSSSVGIFPDARARSSALCCASTPARWLSGSLPRRPQPRSRRPTPLGTACVVHVRGGKVSGAVWQGSAPTASNWTWTVGKRGHAPRLRPRRRRRPRANGDDVDEGSAKDRRGDRCVASLPFAVSMFGDMMMPAAIAGALIGYNSGQARAEVLFERRPGAAVTLRPATVSIWAALAIGASLLTSPGFGQNAPSRPIVWADAAPLASRLEAAGLGADRFQQYVARTHAENRQRVREGDLDHLVFYLLQSTRFTALRGHRARGQCPHARRVARPAAARRVPEQIEARCRAGASRGPLTDCRDRAGRSTSPETMRG